MSVPPSPDPFSTGTAPSFNGYHLLNEVSTGGTLSSLFSILSLFTEDIKLPWGPEAPTTAEDEADDELPVGRPPTKSRTNSDVSQLDEVIVGPANADENEVDSPMTVRSRPTGLPRHQDSDSSTSTGDDHSTIGEDDGEHDGDRTIDASSTLVSERDYLYNDAELDPPPQAYSRSRSASGAGGSTRRANADRAAHPLGPTALNGTIARATVDTTLAVIPAEAFKKLTRKYPKASGTIVQVVLERFSRVTFMTGEPSTTMGQHGDCKLTRAAHKFLGLTREILRSESTLNSLVSHPLPRSFYTGGGMQALRDRFQPESGAKSNMRDFPSGGSSPAPRVGGKDYFNYVPPSPTVKAPSLPSVTPRMGMTPAAHFPDRHLEPIDTSIPETESPTQVSPPRASVFTPDTAARQSTSFVRRHSALRKQVAAGDLAMTRAKEEEKYYYRATPVTPGIPRMDTWRGRSSTSTSPHQSMLHSKIHNGMPVSPGSEAGSDDGDGFDLKAEVVICIAKSIGLGHAPGQPDSSAVRGSVASASILSSPNSPMFPPRGAGVTAAGGSKMPFGNVLDMMNASRQDSGLGGMLREAVMTARLEEDASSVSMSVQESSAGGDAMRGVLRELEANLEVLYFKKGSVLVREGERAPGLYYVIDGFLDVSAPLRQCFASIRLAHVAGVHQCAAGKRGDPVSSQLGPIFPSASQP